MKKQSGFWFTVACWIVERVLFRGYHIAKNPPRGRKKVVAIPNPHEDEEYPEAEAIAEINARSSYPKAAMNPANPAVSGIDE